jgi:hypothetical protein
MQMLDTYPADLGRVDRQALAACIDACFDCAQACTACADACLSESPERLVELGKCIRSDLDCAAICDATGQILSRHTGYDANITRAVLDACALVCRSCAEECERHSTMSHCQACALECRRCENACQTLLGSLG